MSSKNSLQKISRKVGQRIDEILSVTPEEKLLQQRRARRKRFRNHVGTYLVVNAGLLLLLAVMRGDLRAAAAVIICWGVALGLHTVKYRGWLSEHDEELADAESRIRLEGKTSAMRLLDLPRTRGALTAGGPLLLRCEQAAVLTRERLEGLNAEVEVRAVVDEGLERVRELLAYQDEIARALLEAAPERVEEERQRILARIETSRDDDTKKLYRSQLTMLEARLQKAETLDGLRERLTAYGESYLAALSNLRMDIARLKTLDLPEGAALTEVMNPVQEIENQVEGMRSAMQEVARLVKG